MNCPQVALQESHPKASEGDRVAHRGEEGGDGIRRPLLWETQGATGTGAATTAAVGVRRGSGRGEHRAGRGGANTGDHRHPRSGQPNRRLRDDALSALIGDLLDRCAEATILGPHAQQGAIRI